MIVVEALSVPFSVDHLYVFFFFQEHLKYIVINLYKLQCMVFDHQGHFLCLFTNFIHCSKSIYLSLLLQYNLSDLNLS